MQSSQRIQFRLFFMECCGHLLCWVNPRFPSYCPQCGKSVYPQCKGWVTDRDDNAVLKINWKLEDLNQ